MTRRRLLLGMGAALAVPVVAGAVWWLMPPRPGITEANCARIKPGMRLEEVEAILGGQPDSYGTMPVGCRLGPDGEEVPPPPDTPSIGLWAGDEGEANVKFDEHSAAVIARFTSSGKSTFWECLRRLFR